MTAAAASAASDAAFLPRKLLGLAFGNVPTAFDAIAKVRASRSMIAFVELFWPVIEPMQPFIRSWVQETLGKHLELVTSEDIDKLLFNVPPGFSKSTFVNVFFPPWEWGPKQRPDLRYISWSYAAGLTERDNNLCRKIVESPLYQRLWGQCNKCVKRPDGAPRCPACEAERRFRLDGDSNAKKFYRNDWGGFRLASSVGGGGTGYRADRLIFDDPHSVASVESDAERQATIDWFAGTLPSRVRNTTGGKGAKRVKLPDWVARAHGKALEGDDVKRAPPEYTCNTCSAKVASSSSRCVVHPDAPIDTFEVPAEVYEGPRPVKSATIGIMQRVHLRDVSGVILATPELGYTHVLVEMELLGNDHPARIANDNGKIPSPPSRFGFQDPRIARVAEVKRHLVSVPLSDDRTDAFANLGNIFARVALDMATLADPIRYPRSEYERLKAQLLLKSGANAVEAQYQQWPQEIGGDYFPLEMVMPRAAEKTRRILKRGDCLPSLCGYMTRGWDLAATDDNKAAATVGVLGYIDTDHRVIIVDVVKLRGGPDEVDHLILHTTETDGRDVRQDLPRDPGQAGKYQVNAFTRMLMGHEVDHSPEAGKKTRRAYPLSSQWKIGNVWLVEGEWNTEFLRIMSEFPVGTFMDEVDASVRMFDSQVRAEPVSKPRGGRSIKIR